jgi:hypothetical protein
LHSLLQATLAVSSSGGLLPDPVIMSARTRPRFKKLKHQQQLGYIPPGSEVALPYIVSLGEASLGYAIFGDACHSVMHDRAIIVGNPKKGLDRTLVGYQPVFVVPQVFTFHLGQDLDSRPRI